MTIGSWLKTEFTKIWAWLGVEEARAATLLSPIIDELAALLKQDVALDLSVAVQATADAFKSGQTGEALLSAAYDAVTASAKTQGVQLSEEALTALAAALSSGAKPAVN